jgi:hypothetical protein
LCDGFKADGEVNFLGATIGGDFKCSGAQFVHPEGQALIADRAKIEGDVSLNNGFKSWGHAGAACCVTIFGCISFSAGF